MEDAENKTLAERLRWARTQLHSPLDPAKPMSARDLANCADVADALIGMIERGDVKNPQPGTLTSIAGALGITLDWLMTGRGPTPKPRAMHAAVERARTASDARKVG